MVFFNVFMLSVNAFFLEKIYSFVASSFIYKHIKSYQIVPKFSDTLTSYHSHLKILTST